MVGVLLVSDTHKKFLPYAEGNAMTDNDILYDVFDDLNSDCFNSLLPDSLTLELVESEGHIDEVGIYIPKSHLRDMTAEEFRYFLFRQILIWKRMDGEMMSFLCHHYLWRYQL